MSVALKLQPPSELERLCQAFDYLEQEVLAFDSAGIIISPTSSGIKDIFFGQEIIGKSIFETLFKSISSTSSTYSHIQSVITNCFDEGNFQWLLSKDLLPCQISIKNSKDESSKSYQLLYSPIWDDHELLRFIAVIIAETSTGVHDSGADSRLADSEISDHRIIQELANHSVTDLEAFFSSAFALIAESKSLLARINLKSSNLRVIFQNLHTLKGNSHVLGLSLIAERTHATEVETEHIESQSILALKDIAVLNDGLDQLQSTVQRYNRIAKEVFQISNQYDIKMFENIHHLFVRLEEHLGLSFTAVGLHLDDFIRGDQVETVNQAILSGKTSTTEIANSIRILQQIRSTAQTVDNATIEQDAKLLEETLIAIMHGNLISKKSHDHRIRGTYNNLSRDIKATYVHPDMPVYYEGSAMPWVDMAYCLFLFSDQYCACFHREDAEAYTEEKCRLMVQHVKQLSRFASEGGFEYFQVASNRLLNYLTTVGMAQTREKIDLLMGESWSYIQLLCLMNSAFRTGRHVRDDHREMLANFKLGRIETRRISEEALKSQSIFIELLRRMAVDGNHPFTFFQMYELFVKKVPLKDSSRFNISIATTNLFVWGSESLPPIEKYLEQLHMHSNVDYLMEGLAVSNTDLSEAIVRFLGHRGGVAWLS